MAVSSAAAQEPGRYDVVIHEFLPDPTPSRGLPASEFIEIRNRSRSGIDLRNWSVSNGSSTGKINISFLLKPDSVAILCATSSVSAFSIYGSTIGVSGFPAMANEGDTLSIISPSGRVIHAIAWDRNWYLNDVKAEGGWSIEMADVSKPCMGMGNWSASTHERGGTPGKINSIRKPVKDSIPPRILFAYMPDRTKAVVRFSEPLGDSIPLRSMSTLPGMSITGSLLRGPLYDQLEIRWLMNGADSILTVAVSGVKDCEGNEMPRGETVAGILVAPGPKDVVINEVLFNPPADGDDYLEILNISSRNIDLSSLMIANRNGDNRLSSFSRLTHTPFPLYPGQYVFASTDTSWVFQKFRPPDTALALQPASLPSFPDNKGEVAIVSLNGQVIDELHYDEKWHFELVRDATGIALERISPFAATQDAANWHSASTSSGYGTPGYLNSQVLPAGQDRGEIRLSSKLISPDMDGHQDYVMIQYDLSEPGFVANIMVFSSGGRLLGYIARNAILGTKGSFRWDGKDQNGNPLYQGMYIILTELFNLSGTTKKYKHTVAIVRRQ